MDSENSRINLRLARIRRRIILDSQRRRKRTSLCSGNTPQDNYNGTKRRNIAKESFVAGSSSYNQVLAINKSICTQDQSNQNSMHAMRSGSPITRTLLTNVTNLVSKKSPILLLSNENPRRGCENIIQTPIVVTTNSGKNTDSMKNRDDHRGNNQCSSSLQSTTVPAFEHLSNRIAIGKTMIQASQVIKSVTEWK
ncbi:hypothetical protein AAHE18_09G157100 [Arachis hypogaea]